MVVFAVGWTRPNELVLRKMLHRHAHRLVIEEVLQVRFPLPRHVNSMSKISHHTPRLHYTSSPVLCHLLILIPFISLLIPKYLKGLFTCWPLCLEYLICMMPAKPLPSNLLCLLIRRCGPIPLLFALFLLNIYAIILGCFLNETRTQKSHLLIELLRGCHLVISSPPCFMGLV